MFQARSRLGTVILLIALFGILIGSALTGGSVPANAAPAATVKESRDFATEVLRDPWDMNEFSDVSYDFNESGLNAYIENWSVANSVFAGRASASLSANFWLTFPGFDNMIKTGKIGTLYPIRSDIYKCFYMAMNAQSGAGDYYSVGWYDTLWYTNPSGGVAKTVTPNIWSLYSANLTSGNWGPAWTSQAWQGFRIFPTSVKGANFSIDWIRLTDCTAVNTTITWTPASGMAYLWVRPSSTTRDILVTPNGVNRATGSYTFDTQGLAAGTYTVRMSTDLAGTGMQDLTTLTVNQAPIAQVTSPSFISGSDYATDMGSPWNFSSSAAVSEVRNIVPTWIPGQYLDFLTHTGNVADPMFFMNNPRQNQTSLSGASYRYLTFRMNTVVPSIQNVPRGMIARWIWYLNNSNCAVVSHDIPYDVGWQTYSFDLFDAYNGSPVQTSLCPSMPSYAWKDQTNITLLRFDPNENITGTDMRQQIEWIRLTAMDSIARGADFPIQLSLNKSPSLVPTRTFYYTTDPNIPYQHPAQQSTHAPVPKRSLAQTASNPIYLPLILLSPTPAPPPHPVPPLVPNEVDYAWDTSAVAPGTYYICAKLNDGLNEMTYCSQAPVVVR